MNDSNERISSRSLANKFISDAVRLFVSLRRYLARNHPYLWQIRFHWLACLFVTFAVVWPMLALVMPVSRYDPPDPARWQTALFLVSFLSVLYWAFSYYLVFDPGSIPTSIREPAASVLILCSIFIFLPSYGFLAVANYRLVAAFPDVAYEEDATAVLIAFVDSAGDHEGIFKDALPGVDPEARERFEAQYSIGSDGVIGPPSKAGLRTRQFNKELVCRIGEELARRLVLLNKFSLRSLGDDTDVGTLVPTQRNAVGEANGSVFSNLSDAYFDTLKFQIEGAENSNRPTPLCVSFRHIACAKPRIAISVDCESMTEERIDRVLRIVSRTSQSLLRDYVAPMGEAELVRLSSEILTPFCEVGKRREECLEARQALNRTMDRVDKDNLTKRLGTIWAAHGANAAAWSFQATISPALADPRLREFNLTPKEKFVDGTRGPTLSAGWLGGWLFVLSLLAISAKSFRLVRSNSANYVFAALFLVPGILFGVEGVNSGVKYLSSYFNWSWLSFAISGNQVLLAYLALTLAYVTWQVTKRRCAYPARLIASFNLFFLMVLSFYFPFANFPWIGPIVKLEPWVVVVAFILYFGVFYDLCYALARRARERPV